MERYLVYTYYVGRPLGGINDFLDSFASIDDALENLLKEKNRYYQIVDAETMDVVKEGLTIYKDFTPECFSSGDLPNEEDQDDYLL